MPAFGNGLPCGAKRLLCSFGFRDIAQCRMRNAFGIKLRGRGVAVERLILRQWIVDDVLPAAKPDLHMRFGGDVVFHEIRHGRAFDA